MSKKNDLRVERNKQTVQRLKDGDYQQFFRNNDTMLYILDLDIAPRIRVMLAESPLNVNQLNLLEVIIKMVLE